jgi:hypothetical protein
VAKGVIVRIGAGFWSKRDGVDLSGMAQSSEIFRGFAHEHWQGAVRPSHGFSALEHLHADCRALWWRPPGANAHLCRAIPRDGLCSTDLPREPARHRNLPVCAIRKALPHGLSRAGPAIDAGRCQRDARLAHLRGAGATADRPGEATLRQREPGLGPERHGLCSGLDYHRFVPVAVSVGALSLHQGGGEDAHPARSAREHPEFHPHLRG